MAKSKPAKSTATKSPAKAQPKPKSAKSKAETNGHAEPGEELDATPAESSEPTAAPPRDKSRRATAQSMSAAQRDISVSEFFAKNRHMLGFDNPRKALLTTVKEAVDNSLDACEEAGILPEIWVHLEQTGPTRYKLGIQDNGPGIVKKQIPLIFGKLLYGSKFHRLRMSRGQQGIGISAAGMYGVLTTGKPVKIISKIHKKQPAHYYEIQINTKTNDPEILNGKGEGVEIPAGPKMQEMLTKHGIEWVAVNDQNREIEHGTRVTIELEGKYHRGRGSIDEYLEQTAIANPHVRLHFVDCEGNERLFERSTESLPKEPKEIKPHPYGIELGRLIVMLKDTKETTLSSFLSESFSRVSPGTAKKICEVAKLSTRYNPGKVGRGEAEHLFQALQAAKLPAPSTDCISPICEELLLKGLHQVVPGEFYAATTRPPSVYRGNPFAIEAALAFGGSPAAQRVTLESLTEMLSQSDARTLRQFLTTSFAGMGSDAADKIIAEAEFGARQSPSKLKKDDIAKLHAAMRNVNMDEGQAMNVLRYANRVPLQFQLSACAVTQTIMQTNWRAYGLSQSRNALPNGPVSLMVHIASVWVPFTNQSKEAVASYVEIQKEIRLAIQTVGRKLGIYLNRKKRAQQEGERRNIFLRYLGEVADAVSEINNTDRDKLYNQLFDVAKKKTAQADAKYDERGRLIEEGEDELANDKSVLIIPVAQPTATPETEATPAPEPKGKKRRGKKV
jgi:DNA topoisomerase VI subunit B